MALPVAPDGGEVAVGLPVARAGGEVAVAPAGGQVAVALPVASAGWQVAVALPVAWEGAQALALHLYQWSRRSVDSLYLGGPLILLILCLLATALLAIARTCPPLVAQSPPV